VTDDEGVVVTDDEGVVVADDEGVDVIEDEGVIVDDDEGVVVVDDDGVIVTDDEGVVVADDDGVIVTDDEGVVVADDEGVVVVDDDGVIVTDDEGVVVADDEGVVVADDDGVIVTDDEGVVVADDEGVVVVDDDGVLVADDDGVDVAEGEGAAGLYHTVPFHCARYVNALEAAAESCAVKEPPAYKNVSVESSAYTTPFFSPGVAPDPTPLHELPSNTAMPFMTFVLPPAAVKDPPAYNFDPITLRAYTAPFSPWPNALQELKSVLAMWANAPALLPYKSVNVPPATYTFPYCTTA